jgi:hypothetical protein
MMFVFRFLKKDGIETVHWSNQVIEFVNLLQFKKKMKLQITKPVRLLTNHGLCQKENPKQDFGKLVTVSR